MQSFSPELFAFSVPIQVRFSDIDGYMHVNNGVYFNYFEHARAQYLYRLCQWNILETGTVIARIELDYRRPVHFEDRLFGWVRCLRLGNSSFDLEQVLTDEKGTLVYANCLATLVAVSMESMKPIPIPERQRLYLEADLHKKP